MDKSLHISSKGIGPSIVLLHGWGTHSGIWQQTVELLKDDFCVTVFDLPGYGSNREAFDLGSSGPQFDIMCEQINAAITEPAIWLGWSMGGLLATGVALKYPAKVKQLILVASTPRFISDPDSDWQAMEPKTFEVFAEQLQQDYQSTLKRFMLLQTQHADNSMASLKLLRRQWQKIEAPLSEVLEAGLTILQNTDLRNQLSRLTCHLSFIYGQLDTLARPGLLTSMKKYHTKFDWVVIQKAAHTPFLSHVEVFQKQLVKMIADNGGLQ
ncbi:Pimeloyl-[acyl-carrier protein] methyl ester esterase BioH [hydrothermal vent metagenome]|uniref:Pimeloyl-[acyl-carrier protein] methyl ester esterase BioH n=1 Tax=hydrothermal vent metagenome TaxID=652676 RepID=A0A3B0YI61_9ZZZZ